MNTSVLVIDDSEADQFLFKILAEEIFSDITIEQALDGQQAVDLIEDNNLRPDIIFLDINMPKMNGYEFLEKTKDILIQEDVHVIMLSSSTQDSDRNKSLGYPCVKNFIEKPFRIEALHEAINSIH